MLIGAMLAASLTVKQPVYTIDNTYPRVMVISEIKDDTAYCVDAVGFEWRFMEPEDLEKDDIIVCTMYDNGTTSIFDDEIIDIRWTGYTTSDFYNPHGMELIDL